MNDARDRAAVSETHRWNLDALFESDEAWEAAFEAFEADVDELAFGSSTVVDADAFRAALATRDDLRTRGSRLKIYATCRAWTDVADETAQERVRRIEAATARRDAAFEALEAAIRDAGEAHVERLLASDDALAAYDPYVADVFRRGRYRLHPAAEDAVGELEDVLGSPSRLLATVNDRVYDPPSVETPAGDVVEMTRKRWWEASAHAERDYRRRAYERVRAAHREDRVVTAQAYADHLRSHATRADLRGYDDLLDASLDGHFPERVREGLLDAVLEHRGSLQGHFDALEASVGDDLRPWDVRAPVTDSDATAEIPYEDAVEIVVDALAPLGDAYQDRVASFLDAGRVDVQPHADKRGIGGAEFGYDGTPAYLFLNYLGDLPALFVFAHELGHAMHYELARDAQPRAFQRLSWEAGELPSNLHEVLLAAHLLESDRVPDDLVRAVALRRMQPLSKARDVAFARDATAVATGDGTLTADELDRLFRERSTELFGPVEYGDGDGWGWQQRYLDREPMVQFLYVLGRTGALATARKLRTGDLNVETYRAFLRAGDSKPPVALLGDDLGLDLAGGVVERAAAEHARLAGR